jgi:membrane protease YdiL (CAAX protease family)
MIRNEIFIEDYTSPFIYRGRTITLCLEVFLVVALTLALLRVLAQPFADSIRWLLIPLVLVTAALLPTTLRKGSLQGLGLHTKSIRRSIQLCALIGLVIFPLAFGAIFLAQRYALALPLAPHVPGNGWGQWILYQFFYVAAAEELFFRGYLQGILLRIVESLSLRQRQAMAQGLTVVLSAAIFALAHWYVLAAPAALLTFFPGLLFGWLFLRTRSLLAPILFHGFANTIYAVGVCILGQS